MTALWLILAFLVGVLVGRASTRLRSAERCHFVVNGKCCNRELWHTGPHFVPSTFGSAYDRWYENEDDPTVGVMRELTRDGTE